MAGRRQTFLKYLCFIVAIVIFAVIHESLHVLVALAFDEYQWFVVHPYGLEVIFKTEPAARQGVAWGFISGTSNMVTILIGYVLFISRNRIRSLPHFSMRTLGYYATIIFLLVDAFNLSIGPFIYGGDINGIVRGFGINRYAVQSLFFVVLLVNRELIAQKVMPLYGVRTRHPLFIPWFKPKGTNQSSTSQ
ncbi:hypothetical protein IBX73_00830 [candidate division WOR-3 bacterium]|nr:hypothetical protein [candidate division WOR-3 bacterium]